MIVILLVACSLRLPSAAVDQISLTSLGLTAASLEVSVAVDNPLWVDVPLEGWRWELTVAGRSVGKGAHHEPLPLAADAVTLVPIPVDFLYADLWAAAGSAGGEVPYTMAVQLDLATPRGPLTLPMSHEGTLPRLQAPTLDVVALRPSLDGARLRLDVDLSVGLPPGLGLESLTWTAAVDEAVIGEGAARVGAQGHLTLPIALDAKQAALASWSALWGEARALHLKLDGRIATPLGSVPVSLDKQVALDQQPGLAEPGVPRSPSP